jgi:hypothetical protein
VDQTELDGPWISPAPLSGVRTSQARTVFCSVTPRADADAATRLARFAKSTHLKRTSRAERGHTPREWSSPATPFTWVGHRSKAAGPRGDTCVLCRPPGRTHLLHPKRYVVSNRKYDFDHIGNVNSRACRFKAPRPVMLSPYDPARDNDGPFITSVRESPPPEFSP